MTMPTYHAPDSVEQVLALLRTDPSARVLAGGTDLIVQTRAGRATPGAFVDIKRIGRLTGVRRTADGGFAIGAATSCTALRKHDDLAAAWPGLIEAANLIGSVQVRNRATMGGNLCNASPAADSVPALVAAGAVAVIAGPDGERSVAVADVPQGPGRTTLGAGEFIVELLLPARPAGGGDAYLRATPRTEMDIAITGVGAALVIGEGGICTSARIALGAVAPTVVLAHDAAAALVGHAIDDATLDRMAQAVRAVCRPIDDKRSTAEYRTHIAAVLARRAVAIARDRAGDA